MAGAQADRGNELNIMAHVYQRDDAERPTDAGTPRKSPSPFAARAASPQDPRQRAHTTLG